MTHEIPRATPAGATPRSVEPSGAVGRLVPDVRRIVVLRANGLGDFIFVLPALEALRAAYPAAEIVLLGRDWHAAFLAARPGPVDRVVVLAPRWAALDGSGLAEESDEMERFCETMRRERFDLAVQLHGGGRNSNPFIRRLGARLAVGLRAADAPPLDRDVFYAYYQPEVLRYLEVVSLVGARPLDLEPRVAVTRSDLEESFSVVPPDERPIVVLHPGAQDRRRRWPAERFGALGRRLRAAGGRLVVTGTEGEREVLERTAEVAGPDTEIACDALSLGGLTGLLSRAALLVSNDTGPLHLGAAAGAATVPIFWCCNLINAGPLTRRRHRPFVSWRLVCPACSADNSTRRCPHDDSFVADIGEDEVTAAAVDLLGQELAERAGGAPPTAPARVPTVA